MPLFYYTVTQETPTLRKKWSYTIDAATPRQKIRCGNCRTKVFSLKEYISRIINWVLPEDYCKKDLGNFNTELFVSTVGSPCPTLGQLLASRILYALMVGEKQYEIAQARFCTQSCSKVRQLLVNSLRTPHPMGSCRGLPCNCPLAKPDPVLLFLGLFENAKENLKNTKDFLTLRTLKTLEISRKHPKKPRNCAARKTPRKPKTPRKRRTGE